jgi:ribosome-associated translation inhibitor RaiA
MSLEIRGVGIDSALRSRVTTRVTAAVSRLAVSPVTARVTFSDENGPKGGRAMRCAMSLRLPRRTPIQVSEIAETPRLAFDQALAALERQLARYREEFREQKRHPKKYYTAKRLMAPEAEGG